MPERQLAMGASGGANSLATAVAPTAASQLTTSQQQQQQLAPNESPSLVTEVSEYQHQQQHQHQQQQMDLPLARPVARLIIDEPRLSDEALYKCDVTYVRGKCPSISMVRVQMMSLPDTARIYQIQPTSGGSSSTTGSGSGSSSKRLDKGQAQAQQQLLPLVKNQLLGPLNEHDQLRLVCLVEGGRPAPKAVFWRKIDATGRTINLTPTTMTANYQQQQQQQQQQQAQFSNLIAKSAFNQDGNQIVEVALNHTLTSGDLGAKFECHVEHEALDSMRPTARIISSGPQTVQNEPISAHINQFNRQQQSVPDAMLDLHPSAAAAAAADDEIGTGSGSERSAQSSSLSETASSTAQPIESLDSHVIIDLNVGVASLDLFMTKLASGGTLDANQANSLSAGAKQSNASEPLLTEGDLIELECIAYNSKPVANITWLNGSEQIGVDELETAPTTSAPSAPLIKVAHYYTNYNTALSTPVKQQPQQQPQRSQRNKRLLQRNQVQLNSDGQTYNTHSFLSIKLSRHEHRAQISCQAQNGVPTRQQQQQPIVKSIELLVQHAPIVLMEPASGISINEYEPISASGGAPSMSTSQQAGSNLAISQQSQQQSQQQQSSSYLSTSQSADQVQIYCIYSANPSQLLPNSVRWFKDGQPLAINATLGGSSSTISADQLNQVELEDRFIESVTPTGYPVLKIKRVTRHDAGRYDCQLANSVGQSERLPSSESCKLEVNFKPSVQLHLHQFKSTGGASASAASAAGVDDAEESLRSLQEVDLDRDLIQAGAELVLTCTILEAQPNRITKYNWFSVTTKTSGGLFDHQNKSRRFAPSSQAIYSSSSLSTSKRRQERKTGQLGPVASWRQLGATDGQRFKLSALQANFSATSFACSATNSIGQSDLSNSIEVKLSHTPGPSFVQPITDQTLRQAILASGKPAAHHLSASVIDHTSGAAPAPASSWTTFAPPTPPPSQLVPSTSIEDNNEMDSLQQISAGRELLLECVTQDLGQPRANIWLWFKDGQTIESLPLYQQQVPAANKQQQRQGDTLGDATLPFNNTTTNSETKDDLILNQEQEQQDNPISDRLQDLSLNSNNINSSATTQFGQNQLKTMNTRSSTSLPAVANGQRQRQQQQQQHSVHHQTKARLLASGRYLFISSIQLAHKGNYSCVALNRLGPGNGVVTSTAASEQATTVQKQTKQSTQSSGRDSYQLRVALAPSFVQPLEARTYWPEVPTLSAATNDATNLETNQAIANYSGQSNESSQKQPQQQQQQQQQQLELTCHVQCEPICYIEWLRNNELLDLKRQTDNIVSYHVRHTIMAENVETNLFKSIESKLVLQFQALPVSALNDQTADKKFLIDRDKLLERRHYLNNSNFTCQSSSNSMGPSVKSTTQFVVQYPPENVIINAPSDKLNLVEGSNGPYLSCEASGEPLVQYRWLLLKSGNNIITSSDLVAARYNMKHYGNLSSSQLWSKQHSSDAMPALISSGSGGTVRNSVQANDVGTVADSPAHSADGSSQQRFVDLTDLSHGEQVGGASISTLDLTRRGIDRKRSGHYICEASNKLGQTRRSVYVNVLYKPTCATLHMHSLDLTMLDHNSQETLAHTDSKRQQQLSSEPPIMSRPFRANGSDEYSIIRESSDDFISLRRVLVMSPLFNRYSPQLNNGHAWDSELSLKESIFGSILQNAESKFNNNNHHQLISSSGGEKGSLIHDASDNHNNRENSPNSVASMTPYPLQSPDTDDLNTKPTDSWSRFNLILLKFLNNYVRQIKHDESQRTSAYEQYMTRHQRRRSSSVSTTIDHLDRDNSLYHSPSSKPSFASMASDKHGSKVKKSLLTFACMAQEGNPMNNLTFDWYFGSIKLPNEQRTIVDSDPEQSSGSEQSASRGNRPFLIYSNENSTLAIMLTRRLDTDTILNPFQISFVTINVISIGDHHYDQLLDESSSSSVLKQTANGEMEANNNEANNNRTMFMRAPVIKSRYQSFYNGLKANTGANQQHLKEQDNTIQFVQELDVLAQQQQQQQHSRLPHASLVNDNMNINLNEHNWHEKLNQLLKCSVSNSIGTSDPSYVRVNLAERLKSNSLYEFSNWRMQSLASKSLLIISVLFSCAIFAFVTFVQIVVPRLRALESLQKRPDSGSSRDDTGTNTGQSTSSQKSSVLGLLGNGGDSSFQGSSDDDTSARLNQLDSGICIVGNNIQHLRSSLSEHNNQIHHNNNNINNNNSTNLDMYNSLTSNDRLVDGHGGSGGNDSINYDQPRSMSQAPKMIYQPDGGQFNLANDSLKIGADYENYHYDQGNLSTTATGGNQNLSNQMEINSNSGNGELHTKSTSSKILASLKLKPFAKFKVDRISDLPSRLSSVGGGLHDRNVSNSETATTGLSSSDPSENSDCTGNAHASRRAMSSHNFGMPNLRHSYGGLRRHAAPRPMSNAYYPQEHNDDARNNSLVQQQRHMTMNYKPLPNAMDEFMRRRGLDPSSSSFDATNYDDSTLALAYGSQSIRNQSSTLFSIRNDLLATKLPQTTSRMRPPVYPRSVSQQHPFNPYQASTIVYSKPAPPAPPPPIAVRANQRHVLPKQASGDYTNHKMYLNQSLGTTPYAANYSMHQQQQQQHHQYLPSNRIDTIDTHLNRLVDSVALGGYYTSNNNNNNDDVQQQMAYANAFQIQHDPYQANHLQHNQADMTIMQNIGSPEHIYDLNAYATPEQTPLRQTISSQGRLGAQSKLESERPPPPRVSQLIQTFNTKLPPGQSSE